jgi:hypothetical protein
MSTDLAVTLYESIQADNIFFMAEKFPSIKEDIESRGEADKEARECKEEKGSSENEATKTHVKNANASGLGSIGRNDERLNSGKDNPHY